MEVFLHSLVIYIANFILILSLRSVVRHFLSKDVYPYVAEVLGAFLLVANVHENGNVYGHYGWGGFSICLFLLMMVYARVSDAATNPLVTFEEWWNRRITFTDAVLKMMAQLIGSLLAARYMTWLWKTMALSEQQVSRAEFLELTCDSANKVTIPEAMVVELLAAFGLRIFASYRVGGPSLEKYSNAAACIVVILAAFVKMLPLVVFAGVCLFNSLLAFALKKAAHLLLPKDYRQFSSEFCCSFIVVANVFENGNIISEYGIWAFAVALFFLILIYMNIFDACVNPIVIFDQVWNRKRSMWDGVFMIICQVAGGCLGARFIVVLWGSIQLTGQHISRAEFLSQTCLSTNQVTILQGMAAEMAFTMVARIAASYVVGARWEKPVNSLTGVIVVVIGLEWTGSMINPALATAMTYNCENHPFYEHVLVYWLAPFTGSILSDYVEDFLHGKGWRNRDQITEQPSKAAKKKRKNRRSAKSKKSTQEQLTTITPVKNGVSPTKKRKRKEANSNNKKNLNVGS